MKKRGRATRCQPSIWVYEGVLGGSRVEVFRVLVRLFLPLFPLHWRAEVSRMLAYTLVHSICERNSYLVCMFLSAFKGLTDAVAYFKPTVEAAEDAVGLVIERLEIF